MKPAIIAVVAALTASQASALSCLAPDPLASFSTANAGEAPYLVLLGHVTAPGQTGMTLDKPTATLGQFTGRGLTMDGFTADFAGDVVLDVTCAGPWCGSLPGTGEVLVFARVDGDTPTIDLPACGGWVFDQPDQALLDRLTACLNGADCSPQTLQ